MKAQGFLHYKNYGLNLIFKSFSISHTYFNKVGLKVINPKLGRVDLDNGFNQREITILPSQNLFLFFDFLYDEYTLLNTEIKASPHFELMKLLSQKRNITLSSYIPRAKKGTLDMRSSVNYKEAFYNEMFDARMKEIAESKVKPVVVTKIKEAYYVLDGKHRAALMKLLNKPLPCICLEDFDFKTFYAPYWKELINGPAVKFNNHLNFYKEY